MKKYKHKDSSVEGSQFNPFVILFLQLHHNLLYTEYYYHRERVLNLFNSDDAATCRPLLPGNKTVKHPLIMTGMKSLIELLCFPSRHKLQ